MEWWCAVRRGAAPAGVLQSSTPYWTGLTTPHSVSHNLSIVPTLTPLSAVMTTGAGCLGVLVLTSVYYGMYRARALCHAKLYIREDSLQDDNTTI